MIYYITTRYNYEISIGFYNLLEYWLENFLRFIRIVDSLRQQKWIGFNYFINNNLDPNCDLPKQRTQVVGTCM